MLESQLLPLVTHTASVALGVVRDIQSGARPDDDDSLDAVLDALTDPMADAIAAGDQAALFAAVEPAIQADQTLMAWIGAPGVGAWLDGFLTRVRAELVEIGAPPLGNSDVSDEPAAKNLAKPAALPASLVTDEDCVI